MSTPAVHGHVAPGYAGVAAAFEHNFAERGELGAAFAAVVDGELVVDLWGGVADRERGLAWEEDTLAWIYSGAKGLVAVCMLLLIERGALDLEEPVATYWPEFAAHGKGGILVRHVVSHCSGLPGVGMPITNEQATDGVRMAALLAAQPPIAPPGTTFYYHAMTYGWLCGELVRRVDGRSVGRFFAEEVAAPLGLEAWIGLPDEHAGRVARLERGATLALPWRGQDDPVAWSVWDNPPRFADGELPANTRAWQAAELPATGAIVGARSLARLYGCLAQGGEIDGTRLLEPETIALGACELARGRDPYLDAPMAFGVGFQLQVEAMHFGPEAAAFGHGGTGGSAHGAWPTLNTGFSYAMNLLQSFPAADPRPQALLAALHSAVAASAAGTGLGGRDPQSVVWVSHEEES